jgi:uncharacterized protein YaiL (DUF2058 family)
MSMSLRDQLLKAGLVSKKQVAEVERQQQHQARQPAPKKPPPRDARRGAPAAHAAAAAKSAPQVTPAQPVRDGRPAPVVPPGSRAAAEKAARDLALNRKQQEKARRKALHAEVKQLIGQNRLAPIEGADFYNFVDDGKIRKIPVDAAVRARLIAGQLVIVRHEGRYDLVAPAVAERIREREPGALVPPVVAETQPLDDAYRDFPVPDDLTW